MTGDMDPEKRERLQKIFIKIRLISYIFIAITSFIVVLIPLLQGKISGPLLFKYGFISLFIIIIILSIYVYILNSKSHNKIGRFKIPTKAIFISIIIAISEITFILFYHKFIILLLVIMVGIIVSGVFTLTSIQKNKQNVP